MNFLAHFQLAAPDKSLMFGNYIADFITNKQLIDFSVPVRQGIMLHRAIDTFTDNHEATKSAIQVIRPYYQKYSPVLCDIFFDYFLASNWDKFEVTPLEVFIQSCYELVRENYPTTIVPLNSLMERMLADNFLHNSISYTGLQRTAILLQRRLKFPLDLTNAEEVVIKHHQILNDNFLLLYNDLSQFANQWILSNVELSQ
ncbi:MAG: ACP phosphodiesterase [Saprospiraceae bacterium]